MLTYRENYLRAARFQWPEYIPCDIGIVPAAFTDQKREMVQVILRHPFVFARRHGAIFRLAQEGRLDSFEPDLPAGYHEGAALVDAWGCRWENRVGGLESIVTGHPLADWQALSSYRPPDPLQMDDRGPADWAGREAGIREQRRRGELTTGGTAHGFLFDRLTYLRGFENLMLDLATGAEQLPRLIDLVMQHSRILIDRWLGIGLDVMLLADDLGAQTASMVSPRTFRQWFTPCYRELAARCRQAGTLVALHSDGHILELMEEFVAAGIDIINPQDLVNGIDNLAREVKGRLCVHLDVDRQRIVPFGSRQEIRELIAEEVRKLGDPRGGLAIRAGIYPPTTPDRVDALASAMEEFATYWWHGRGENRCAQPGSS